MKNTEWFLEHAIRVDEREFAVSPSERIKQIVFNQTNINYMALVDPQEWSRDELIFETKDGKKITPEHHSVFVRYRTEKAIFTLFRFKTTPYYGEALKELVGRYFGETLYNEQEMYATGKTEDFVLSFIFKDGYEKKAYFYKAFDGKHYSSIPMFSNCPFWIKQENYSVLIGDKGQASVAGTCSDCPYHQYNIQQTGMSVCKVSPII